MGHEEDSHRGKFVSTQKTKLERTHIFKSMLYLKDIEKQEQTIL